MAELDQIKKLLRSVLQGVKGGVDERDLLGDYKMITGELLPYKKLGYPRLEDFMIAIPDTVKVTRRGNGLVFEAVADESTAHIQRMVSAQRSKKKKKGGMRRPTASHQFQWNRGSHHGASNIRKKASHFTSKVPPLIRASPQWSKPFQFSSPHIDSRGNQAHTRSVVPLLPLPMSSSRKVNLGNNGGLAISISSNGKPKLPCCLSVEGNRMLLNSLKDIQSNDRIRTGYEVPPRFLKNQASNPSNHITRTDPDDETLKIRIKELVDMNPCGIWLSHLPNVYRKQYGEELTTACLDKIQDWQGVVSIEKLNRKTIICPLPPQLNFHRELNVPEAPLPSPGSRIPVIPVYAEDCSHFYVHSIDKNDITSIMSSAAKIYSSNVPSVKICDLKPGLYVATQYEGSWYRSQITTLNDTDLGMTAKVFYIDFGNSEIVSVDKIKPLDKSLTAPKQILKCSLHGIYPRSESTWKEATTKLSTLIQKNQKVIMEIVSIDNGVCKVNLYKEGIPLSLNEKLLESKLACNKEFVPAEEAPPLLLPEEDDWDVWISYIKNPAFVVIHLIGDNYLEQLAKLELEIQQNSSNCDMMDMEISEGMLCAAKIEMNNENPWYRVKVLEIRNDGKVHCELLDYGDKEVVPRCMVRPLMYEENQLPYQAIPTQLTGLENCKNEYIIQQLSDITLQKNFVGAVNSREGGISITLWDTSTDEDINVNAKLIQLLSIETLKPKLPARMDTVLAWVTYISDSGQIFIQIPGPGAQRLEQLSSEISARLKQKDEPSAASFVSNPTEGMLCLALYDDLWYRAEILKVIPGRKVLVNYIDYGNCQVTSFNSLRDVKPSSRQLYKLPPQALEIALDGLPPVNKPWTLAALERLNELLPPDTLIHVEVISEESCNEDGSIKPATAELYYDSNPDGPANLCSVIQELLQDKSIWEEKTESLSQADNDEESIKLPDAVPSTESFLAKLKDSVQSMNLNDKATDINENQSQTNFQLSNKPLDSASKLEQVIPHQPSPRTGSEIHITYTTSPSDFRFVISDMIPHLKYLMEELQDYCNDKTKTDNKPSKLVIGETYAVNLSSIWYRATLHQNSDDDQLLVIFIDYGDFDVVSAEDVLVLPKKFRILPAQAFKAKLVDGINGVAPSTSKWSDASKERFDELCREQKMTIWIHQIEESEYAPILTVTLIRNLKQGEEGESFIHKLLIDEKMAIKS